VLRRRRDVAKNYQIGTAGLCALSASTRASSRNAAIFVANPHVDAQTHAHANGTPTRTVSCAPIAIGDVTAVFTPSKTGGRTRAKIEFKMRSSRGAVRDAYSQRRFRFAGSAIRTACRAPLKDITACRGSVDRHILVWLVVSNYCGNNRADTICIAALCGFCDSRCSGSDTSK
jgi:hypothetical protein